MNKKSPGRIPVSPKPNQTHKLKTDYDRKEPIEIPEGTPDWQVDCPHCGVFIQIQKTEPTICPHCQEPDIDTFNLGA